MSPRRVWLLRVVLAEARFRAAGTGVALLGVLAPVALVCALWLVGTGHGRMTEAMLAAKEQTTQAQADTIRDRYTEIGRGMGPDMAVLPAGVDLQQYYAAGSAAQTIPESAVVVLARVRPAGLDRIVARLGRLIEWPEQRTRAFLVGVGREHVFAGQGSAPANLSPVPAGYVRVGHRLASDLGLSAGQRITVRGVPLTVAECMDEAGSQDDMSLWVDLAQAQRLLDAPGQVSEILATSGARSQAEAEAVAAVIQQTLPGTRVVPCNAGIRTRERMLRAAEAVSGDMVAMERRTHREVSSKRVRSFGAIGLIAAVVGAAWVAAASYVNTRQRRREIGILRTVGWSGGHVMALFAWKGVLLGLAGALGGVAAGTAAAYTIAAVPVRSGDWLALAAVTCAGLVVCAVAYTVPAFLAAGRSPADTVAGR